MGTSAASKGPGSGTPLVPTWLGTPPPPSLPPTAPQPPPVAPLSPSPPIQPNLPLKGKLPAKIEPATEPQRFRNARRAFGSYARNGDTSSLGRALRHYVNTSSGGGHSASGRMAVPKRAASRILSFAQAVQANGTNAALAILGLGELAGRPVAEIYPQLIDALCSGEDGGLTDEAIARNALTEAVAEICDEGMASGTSFTLVELNELFVRYVSRTIFDRVITDIGQSTISLPTEVRDVQELEVEILDTIRGAVRDSIGDKLNNLGSISSQQLSGSTDEIYQLAFDLIALRGKD